MDDKIQVLPDIVVITLMEFKALIGITVKFLLIDVANKAEVFHVFLLVAS
jgi:hypothetical protein